MIDRQRPTIDIDLLSTVARSLDRSERGRVDVDDYPALEVVAYRGAGDTSSAPIILVHGAWHAAWCWDEGFAERLASMGHDVFAMSLRGHGASEGRRSLWRVRIRDHVADLGRVVDSLDRPPILIGHSRGAFIIQKYLETNAARIAAVVLLAPVSHRGVAACMGRLARKAPWHVLLMHASFGACTMMRRPDDARRLLFSRGLTRTTVRRHHARLQGEAFLAYLDLLGLDPCRPRKDAVPMLVLAAGADAIITPEEVRATAAAHGVEPTFVPGIAHDMMLDSGWEDVVDRIATWAHRNARRYDIKGDQVERLAGQRPTPANDIAPLRAARAATS